MLKKRLLGMVLFAAGSMFGQVSIGITIGPPPPPPRVVQLLPPTPGPEFVWVEGYWYPVGNHYKRHPGYWTRPPYAAVQWVAPRHDGERFFDGYWEGDHGRRDHDHHWDRDRDHDFRDGEHHHHHDKD